MDEVKNLPLVWKICTELKNYVGLKFIIDLAENKEFTVFQKVLIEIGHEIGVTDPFFIANLLRGIQVAACSNKAYQEIRCQEKLKKNAAMDTPSSSRVMFDEESVNGLILSGGKYLPDEMLMEIFCHADYETLLRCQLVCKRWRMLIGESKVWQKKRIEKVLATYLYKYKHSLDNWWYLISLWERYYRDGHPSLMEIKWPKWGRHRTLLKIRTWVLSGGRF